MKDTLLKKSWLKGMIVLFVGVNIVSSISGDIGKIYSLPSEEENVEIGVITQDSNLVGWYSFEKGDRVIAHNCSGNLNDRTIYDTIWTMNTPSNEQYSLSFVDSIPPEVTITNPEAGYIYLLGIKIPRKIEKWVPKNATACIGGFFFMAKIEANITDKETGVNYSSVYAYIDQKPNNRSKLDYKGSGKYVGNLIIKGIFIEGLNTANLIVEAKDYYNNLGNDTVRLKLYFKILG